MKVKYRGRTTSDAAMVYCPYVSTFMLSKDDKIDTSIKYARVFHRRRNGDDMEMVDEDPIGVITLRKEAGLWIKVGRRWLTWTTWKLHDCSDEED